MVHESTCCSAGEVISDLKGYRVTGLWRHHQGPCPGAWRVGFDDSGWREVSLPHSWDARKGEAWFRRVVVVPAEVGNVDVSGSAARLCSSVMTIGAEVYVNGTRVYFAPYWADLRGPSIVLSGSVRPGDRFVVVVHAFSMEGLGSIPAVTVEYSAVEEAIFELERTVEALRFVSRLDGVAGVAERAGRALDLQALRGKDWPRVRSSLGQVREILKEADGLAKSYTVHMVGHAHIDMNWLWPWEDTVDVVRRDFDTVTAMMAEIPELRFSQSQAFLYRLAEEKFPLLFQRVRERVASGQWEVTASTWVEGDLNMACGEAIARHILYSKRYLMTEFAVDPKVCWEPDTFGHPWTLPQILRKAGISYYYHMRAGTGAPLYLWEGPDGSRVLAFNELNTYNNSSEPRELVDRSLLLKERAGARNSLIVYGVGDHGGGPTRSDVGKAKALDGEPGFPGVKLARAAEFFDAVAGEALDLPVVRDELNCVFDGCYTTHGDIKRHNRRCESLLLDAEVFAALSSAMGATYGATYPYDSLWTAWDITLFNQFHDILDGSAIAASYVYSGRLAEKAEESASAVMRAGLSGIAAGIGPRGAGVPIAVFNSLGWDRTDVVAVPATHVALPASPVMRDGEGKLHPVQVVGDRFLFVAPGVPSVGYRVFYLCDGGSEAPAGLGPTGERGSMGEAASVDELRSFAELPSVACWRLENEHLRVMVDPGSGCLMEMYDKAAGRTALTWEPQPFVQPVGNNLLQVLYEAPHPMSAWIIGPIVRVENLIRDALVEPVEMGPVRAVVRVIHHVGHSTITQDLTLYRGVKRLDFVTELDWREESGPDKDAPMVKAAFTPDLGKCRATFEIPYGYIERWPGGREVPALRWVDLSSDEYGVSLLNDGKYGFDVAGSTMRITLVRTSYEPDPHPDQGIHRFTYSIYPHEGDWREGETQRRAEELNRPLAAVVLAGRDAGEAEARGGGGRRQGAVLPEAKSFVRVSPRNAVVSCIKRAEDDSGLVVRLYESEGRAAEVEVEFGFAVSRFAELDLVERPVTAPDGGARLDGHVLRFTLNRHEIRTFLVR